MHVATVDTEERLITKCAQYLRATYGEELVKHDILDNSVEDGDGSLKMNCTVRTGATTSRWQKTFTFENGRVADMAWRHLG